MVRAVWGGDGEEDELACKRAIRAVEKYDCHSPRTVAEWYAEQCFNSGDYQQEMEVYVRAVDGEIMTFVVFTQQHVSFHAKMKPKDEP